MHGTTKLSFYFSVTLDDISAIESYFSRRPDYEIQLEIGKHIEHCNFCDLKIKCQGKFVILRRQKKLISSNI